MWTALGRKHFLVAIGVFKARAGCFREPDDEDPAAQRIPYFVTLPTVAVHELFEDCIGPEILRRGRLFTIQRSVMYLFISFSSWREFYHMSRVFQQFGFPAPT